MSLASSNEGIIINEFFLHSAENTTTPQYIELYNNSSQVIDIANWKLATFDSFGQIILQTPFISNPNFIQINNYIDSNGNNVYDTNEPILIEPYSYFIISSSFCSPINYCTISSEFYNNMQSDILMSYLVMIPTEGSFVLSNENDAIIDEIIYDENLYFPNVDDRGYSWSLISTDLDNSIPSNWYLSNETEISEWLYDLGTEVNNFGSPRAENQGVFILGDVNLDGELNVLDIVFNVSLVLNGEYNQLGDINEDGFLNVLDIVALVDIVLNP